MIDSAGSSAERVRLSGAQETMLGTLWCRAVDADSRHPILGDPAARDLVDRIDYPFARLGGDPMMVAVTCTRARWMDQRARSFLAVHPTATVVHLACGLDTRHQRLRPGPGVQWFEIDHPDVIAVRRQLVPALPGVELVATDIADPAWLTTVSPDRPTLVIAEGLSMYLDPRRGAALLTQLATRARGELIMDMNGRGGVVGQYLNHNVRRSGARWTWFINDPGSLQRCGLQLLEHARSIDLVRRLGPRHLPVAAWLALQAARVVPTPRSGMLARYGLPGP